EPLQIMADLKLVGHAHSPVQLYCLLGDVASRFADLSLRRRGALCCVAALRDGGIESVGDCDGLPLRDEHVDQPMLEHLKRSEWHAELLARFRVFKGCLVEFADGADRFSTLRGNRPGPPA